MRVQFITLQWHRAPITLHRAPKLFRVAVCVDTPFTGLFSSHRASPRTCGRPAGRLAKGERKVRISQALVVTAALSLLAVHDVTDALASKCASAKMSCAAKFMDGKTKCVTKAELKGETVDPACTLSAADKFVGLCMAKAMQKTDCYDTSNDDTNINAAVDATLAELVALNVLGTGPQCPAAEKKCVAKLVKAELKCHQQVELKGLPAVDGACLNAATSKFNECSTKAFAKGDCGPIDYSSIVAQSAQTLVATVLGNIDPECGDGVPAHIEVCDDGNNNDCDGGCNADCSATQVCGNGVTECGEECDIVPVESCLPDCTLYGLPECLDILPMCATYSGSFSGTVTWTSTSGNVSGTVTGACSTTVTGTVDGAGNISGSSSDCGNVTFSGTVDCYRNGSGTWSANFPLYGGTWATTPCP